MSTLTASARLIHDTLPTLGGQKLLDADRDLATLVECAMMMARRNLPGAVPGDIALIRGLRGDIELRHQAWSEEIHATVEERYPSTSMEPVQGTATTIYYIEMAMDNIETTGHVVLSIDGVETTMPGDNVRIDGETLIVEDTRGVPVLDLALRDVAAFGFA